MRNHKAFALVELIVMLPLMGVLAGVTTVLFTSLVHDVPTVVKEVQTKGILLSLLKQMRQDVEAGDILPAAGDEPGDAQQRLVIASSRGNIVYEMRDSHVIRHDLAAETDGYRAAARYWSLGRGDIEWRVWRKYGVGYAVEIQASVERLIPGGRRTKLANSHVYFVGLKPGGRQ